MQAQTQAQAQNQAQTKMNTPSSVADLVLVQGLYNAGGALSTQTQKERDRGLGRHAQTLGVVSYERVDGRGRRITNSLLRRMRGTISPVDAVEIISINENGLRKSLENDAGRALWRKLAGCEPGGYDTARSFLLMGKPIRLLEGDSSGQRLLWFGNGLDHLSRAKFIEHYTSRHGPLVAGYAQVMGLHSYQQVPDEQAELCASLRELGLGQAPPPAVFAQLVMAAPPLTLSTLRARRAATREIEADEQRHIDFGRSMLLLTAGKQK